MGVGAAPAEGVDARVQRAVGRQVDGFGGDLQIVLGERDLRVGLLGVQAARDVPVPQRQHGLDQPGESGRRLQVTDVALGGADEQRPGTGRADPAQGAAQRLGLDRVPAQGAGAVRLDVGQPVQRDARPLVHLAQQLGLRLDVGGDQAVPAAVVVDGAVHDDAVDPVAVRERPVQPLQPDADRALAAHEPVGLRGERPAVAVGRQAAEVGQPDGVVGREDQVDAADEGAVQVAGAQRARGQVQRHQAGGAARLHDHAGAAQPEEVRDAGRDDVQGVADGGVLRGRHPPLLAGGLVVVPQRAHVHPGAGAADGGGRDTGVLQRQPADLQHQPLLRVEVLGLAGRDAEEARVELVDVLQQRRHRRDLLGRVELHAGVPALRRHRTHRLRALGQEPPVRVDVRGAGEAARHADHRDRHPSLPGGQGLVTHARSPRTCSGRRRRPRAARRCGRGPGRRRRSRAGR
ncbi:hypothetical protein RKD48_002972 [Streptomyces ambofaciens]